MRDVQHKRTPMSNTSRIPKAIMWSLVSAGLILVIIKALFIGNYRIPQNGMYPGLPAGSRVFTSKRAYSDVSQVRRGDIVVFIRDEGGQHYLYIWRVIGLPGDVIATAGKSLTINGQPVVRESAREEQGSVIFRERIGDVRYEVAFNQSPKYQPPDVSLTVPAEHFFMMGDNRFDARDSRYLGPVAFNTFIGRKL